LLSQDTYHIQVKRFFSERFRTQPQRPLLFKLQRQNDDLRADNDVTYTVSISTRRKPIASVRANHGRRSKDIIL